MPEISGSIISVLETTLFITSFTTHKNDLSSLELLFEIAKMSEDERYRKSSQYRDWSFTPNALLDLRTITNQNAAFRVREAVQRVREARAISSSNTSDTENGRSNSAISEGEIDCLTVEEELKLVTFYCRQTIQLGDHLKLPTEVKVRTLHCDVITAGN